MPRPVRSTCSSTRMRCAAASRILRRRQIRLHAAAASKHHHEHLWRGLRNYDLQVVSTDHCPFCMKDQKTLGRDSFAKIPNGMPGIETRLHLLHDAVNHGQISLNRFVEITSTAPAKIFGLYPKRAR